MTGGNISGETILQALDIGKSFGGVPVLKHVDLEIRKGEVHALMGGERGGQVYLNQDYNRSLFQGQRTA